MRFDSKVAIVMFLAILFMVVLSFWAGVVGTFYRLNDSLIIEI
jgi:hypothetical protein